MGSHLTGAKLKQGFLKVRFWGLCYFLYNINDITDEIQSKCLLCADDTSLFEVVDSPDNTGLNPYKGELQNGLSQFILVKLNVWHFYLIG